MSRRVPLSLLSQHVEVFEKEGDSSSSKAATGKESTHAPHRGAARRDSTNIQPANLQHHLTGSTMPTTLLTAPVKIKITKEDGTSGEGPGLPSGLVGGPAGGNGGVSVVAGAAGRGMPS